MKRNRWLIAALIAFLVVTSFYGFRRWGGRENPARAEVLDYMPAGASAVFFADLADLRASAFLKELFAWAPRTQIDAEYAQFLRETGFDYERDLDRLAIAMEKHGQEVTLIAVADGRFDRKKIAAYAAKSGNIETRDGREIFSVPASASSRQVTFTFLRNDRIELTNAPGIVEHAGERSENADRAEWRERFWRLAGSPIFAVIRQDAATGDALARQAPGKLQSPQLSALLNQLQWITIAGKPFETQGLPAGGGLRLIAEGECASGKIMRQLEDLLNGVLVLAQGGLNDVTIRKQLDPRAREAYLELLKSADVSRIDRGDTKSVRVVFDITPKLLEVARTATPAIPVAPQVPPGKTLTEKGAAHKK